MLSFCCSFINYKEKRVWNGEIRMKTKIISATGFVVILAVGSIFIGSCNKATEDRTPLALLAILYNQNAAKSANTTASLASAGLTTVNSVIATQAGAGTLTLNGFPQSKYQLASVLAKKHLDTFMGQKPVPYMIPTALTTTTGGCNTSSCNATIDGTANCTLGGTFTLTSFSYLSTITTGTPFIFDSTFNGPIAFNSCKVQAYDFLNFPSFAQTILGGNVVVSGTSNISANLTTAVSVISSNMNITSSNLTMNNGSPVSMNMNEIINLTQTASISNSTSSTVGTVTTSSFAFTVVLSGTIGRSGTVDGVNISGGKTYNGESFTFTATCISDSATGSASCSIN